MLKETYKKLEPQKYSRVELTDFEGVYLKRSECISIIESIVKLELENNKLRELKASEKPSNCILGDVSNRYDRSDMEYAYNADRGWQTFDKFIEEYDAPI